MYAVNSGNIVALREPVYRTQGLYLMFSYFQNTNYEMYVVQKDDNYLFLLNC